MIIFKDRVPLTTFKEFILHQPGRFLLRLAGINFSDKAIEPVYKPLFTFDKVGDFYFINFIGKEKSHLFILSWRKPHFVTQTIDLKVTDDEQ